MDRIDAVWEFVLRYGDLDERSVASVAQVHRASRAVLAQLLGVTNIRDVPALGRYRMAKAFHLLGQKDYRFQNVDVIDYVRRSEPEFTAGGRGKGYLPELAVGGLLPGTQFFWRFRIPAKFDAGCSDGCKPKTCWDLVLRDVVAKKDLPGSIRVHNFDFNAPIGRCTEQRDVPHAYHMANSDGWIVLGNGKNGDVRIWQIERNGAAAAAAGPSMSEIFSERITTPDGIRRLGTATAGLVEGVWRQMDSGTIFLWRLDGKACIRAINYEPLPGEDVRYICPVMLGLRLISKCPLTSAKP